MLHEGGDSLVKEKTRVVEKQVVEKLVEQVMEQFSDAIAFYSEMKWIGGKEDCAGLSKYVVMAPFMFVLPGGG